MPLVLENRLKNFLASNWRENQDGWIFCNGRGKPMQRDKVVYKLQKTLSGLGIKKAGLHAFRHMAASELLEAGAAQPLYSAKCVTAIRASRFRAMRTSLATRSARPSIHSLGACWAIELESTC